MNWIKQNKFLSGFIAVMVIGVGALGFLLFQAQSKYAEARTDYESKAQELNRLEGLKPYPEVENLKQIEAQKTQFIGLVDALHKNVAAAQIPLEPLSREVFQDKLRETVTRISADAKGKLALPAMFYLGMQKYQSEPPLPDAAPVLGRQLKALDFIITKMIEVGIVGITKFDRDPLPEEEGKGKKEKETSSKPAPTTGKADKSGKTPVIYHSVEIDFIAEQSRFRNFLNALVAEKSQFYVPRLVVVKNEKPDAPMRLLAGATPADPAKPADDNKEKLVFGGEKINVSLVLDIVDFAEVATK